MYNNRRTSPLAAWAKLRYYRSAAVTITISTLPYPTPPPPPRLFAWLYGKAGATADTVMVNSSWTEEHVRQLWGGEVGA